MDLKARIEKAKQVDLKAIITLQGEKSHGHYKSGKCPFHQEETPGAFMVYNNRFRCMSTKCEASGDIFNWFAYLRYGDPSVRLRGQEFLSVLNEILGTDVAEVTETAKEKDDEEEKEEVDLFSLASSYHEILISKPKRLAYFFSRLFRYRTIKEEMWGWDGQHYCITVWAGQPRSSELLSIRLRVDNEFLDDGMMRYSGIKHYNDRMLYNRAALIDNTKVVLCFYGEFDARLAYQDGLPAVSPTNGAKSVLPEWFNNFRGDVVFVPDKKEEHDAYEDAKQFGSRGWVAHIPRKKDYTEFRQSGGTADLFVSRMPAFLSKKITSYIAEKRK